MSHRKKLLSRGEGRSGRRRATTPGSPRGKSLWGFIRGLHQFHAVLVVGFTLMLGALVSLAVFPAGDPLALLEVPIVLGALLTIGTMVFSPPEERRGASMALLVVSAGLVGVASALFVVHLADEPESTLVNLSPLVYALALSTLALPILALDLKEKISKVQFGIRVTMMLLVPLSILLFSLIISPPSHAVTVSFSFAAFLLMVDALLKLDARPAPAPAAPVAPDTAPPAAEGSSPEEDETPGRAPHPEIDLNAIFADRAVRYDQVQAIFDRASSVGGSESWRTLEKPEDERTLPVEESPAPAAPEPAVPSEVVPATPVPEPVPPSPPAASKAEASTPQVEIIVDDTRAGKESTGISRLDSLLRGGFPRGSQLAVIGPVFTGKEIVVYTFLAAGLTLGEPILVVTTSRSYSEVMRELVAYKSDLEALADSGQVFWIDAFAGDTFATGEHPNMTNVSAPGDYAGIVEGITQAVHALRSRGRPFRVAYLSLSGSMTQSDERRAFGFLRTLQALLRPEEATTLYLVDRGVLEERHLEELQATMDGRILFKTEGDRNYLQVSGLSDVVTRQWVEYQRTGKTLSMGSFALERIR